MNRITILGIIIIAIGTIATYWVAILGSIIIVVGTGLTIYGPSIDSKKDKKELNDKLEEFSEKLSEIKIEGGDTSIAVEDINNEFNDWAKKFVESKGLMKIEMEKSEIEVKQKEEILSIEWRKFYLTFFNTLNNLIEAYNNMANTEHGVEFIRKETVPGNLFSKEAKSFFWVIKFKENVFWLLNLSIDRPIKEDTTPAICLYLLDKYSDKDNFITFAPLRIITMLGNNYILLLKEKWFNEINLEKNYALQEYEKHLKIIVQTIFEQQLLRLN